MAQEWTQVERAERIMTMWWRFIEMLLAEGIRPPAKRPGRRIQQRQAIMASWIYNGQPAGWWFDNAMEATDLSISPECAKRFERFEPQPARRPTLHLQGSVGKVAVLERRARAGEELWHADDAA